MKIYVGEELEKMERLYQVALKERLLRDPNFRPMTGCGIIKSVIADQTNTPNKDAE